MSKRTLIAILAAVGIAGGSVAVSQLDPATRSNLSSRITNAAHPIRLNQHVDLGGKRASVTELEAALSSASGDLGYSINFKKVYSKGYTLGSVRETSDYLWTEVSVRNGVLQGLDITFYTNPTLSGFNFRPNGFISDEEIKQYLSAVSNHLSEQQP